MRRIGGQTLSQTNKALTERRNVLLTYFIAFTIGGIILLIGLWQCQWDFGVWLEHPFVFWTLIFSTTIVRLVAGFGLILTWIAVFELFLTVAANIIKSRRTASLVKEAKITEASLREKVAGVARSLKISEIIRTKDISDAYKGRRVSALLEGKRGQKAKAAGIVFFLVVVPIAILAYTSYRFLLFFLGGSLSVTDVAILLIGVWGLLISVYLAPIARGERLGLTGKLAELRDKLRELEIKKSLYSVKNRILRLYKRKAKKEAKAEIAPSVEEYAETYSASHAQDVAAEYEKIGYEKVRETILTYRFKIRDDLLLPFALGSLILPPIAFVFFTIWARAFLLRKEVGQTLAERLIVFAGVLLAGLYASGSIILMYLYPVQEHSLLVALNGTYLLGTFIGCTIFIYLARKALATSNGRPTS
jgi:hypothetical protein